MVYYAIYKNVNFDQSKIIGVLMSEFEEYKKLGEPDKREKSEIWETAIGLQKVDGLKPSKYLIHTAKSHIEGDITFEDVKNQLFSYYQEKPAKTDSEKEELEADIVSARIAEILSEKAFSLSFVEFISIHKRLFDFAGTIRSYNIEKKEWVLDGKSVTYGNHPNIKAYIEYDLQEEKKFSYKGLNKEEILNHIAEFTSRIWQIHAFGEGNTRTVAVFLIKYLRTLGFDIDNTLFAENSWYFRNSLVRANYVDYANNVYATNEFLVKFLENLLFNGKNWIIFLSSSSFNQSPVLPTAGSSFCTLALIEFATSVGSLRSLIFAILYQSSASDKSEEVLRSNSPPIPCFKRESTALLKYF